MKKTLSVVVALLLVVALFAACGTKNDTTTDGGDTTATTGEVSTGLYISSSLKGSDAGTEDGTAGVTSTIAAVTVDENGKICSCVIDEISGSATFDATGAFTSDVTAAPVSKDELGASYGMSKASSIGKEWNEEVAAFAEYCVGKTADELSGIALDDGGKPTDADLSSSVTLSVANYIECVRNAVANAQKLGASADDELKLAVSASVANSAATAGTGGAYEADYTVCALTLSASGVISSCALDMVQGKVEFDATGVVTTDVSAALLSKDQLKENYNMKGASAIGKEWYEQAAAFAAYCVGKTPAEVAGISLTSDGKAAELTTSVTIHVGDFLSIIAKAAQ